MDLFNGRNLDGWIWSYEDPPPPPSWRVENGLLRTAPEAGARVYLLTRDFFEDFDFTFEWKADPGGNSGVKYRFQGFWPNTERIEPIALEYQIADDETHPDAVGDPLHSTGALYEFWPAAKAVPAKANVWHTGRIVVQDLHIQHWLDGAKVVDVRIDSPEMQVAFKRSRRKNSPPLLAKHERRSSPIALQFHDERVWFRNLRITR